MAHLVLAFHKRLGHLKPHLQRGKDGIYTIVIPAGIKNLLGKTGCEGGGEGGKVRARGAHLWRRLKPPEHSSPEKWRKKKAS